MAKWAHWGISAATKLSTGAIDQVFVREMSENNKPRPGGDWQEKTVVALGITFENSYVTILKNPMGWVKGADVHAHIVSEDEVYLRTDANRTKADNLGNLPAEPPAD